MPDYSYSYNAASSALNLPPTPHDSSATYDKFYERNNYYNSARQSLDMMMSHNASMTSPQNALSQTHHSNADGFTQAVTQYTPANMHINSTYGSNALSKLSQNSELMMPPQAPRSTQSSRGSDVYSDQLSLDCDEMESNSSITSPVAVKATSQHQQQQQHHLSSHHTVSEQTGG